MHLVIVGIISVLSRLCTEHPSVELLIKTLMPTQGFSR